MVNRAMKTPAIVLFALALIGMSVVSRAYAAPPDFDGVWLPDVKDQKRQETENVPPWKPDISRKLRKWLPRKKRGGRSWFSAIVCPTACQAGC